MNCFLMKYGLTRIGHNLDKSFLVEELFSFDNYRNSYITIQISRKGFS